MKKTITSTLRQTGFTLVELVAVLVILGIVAAIGSQFIVTAIDSYRKTELRSKLIAQGRTSIEQMTRQLRNALPNGVRVSGTGNCLEFLPVVGGASYIGTVADAENGITPLTTAITTAPFILGLGDAEHAVISGLSLDEIYVNGTPALPASRADINSIGASPHTSITLLGAHRFNRNSINKRVFITDNPIRFCLSATQLVQYQNYGLDTGALDDTDPGGETLVLANNVSTPSLAFSLSPGSEDRNTAIDMAINFSERGEQVLLNGRVLVRNVP